MARRTLRFPFVVTVATTAASTACGGVVFVDAASDTTSGGGGASTSSASSSGGGTSVATGVSSSSGSTVICPPAMPPGSYDPCNAAPGVCSYEVACQSGTVTLSFNCADGYWKLEPTPCAQPFDSCPGTEYYCDMTWWMPEGTNPPSPCPATPPPVGEMCYAGGMGGVWAHCGYHCTPGDPSTAWMIATCDEPNAPGVWSYDEACNDL